MEIQNPFPFGIGCFVGSSLVKFEVVVVHIGDSYGVRRTVTYIIRFILCFLSRIFIAKL